MFPPCVCFTLLQAIPARGHRERSRSWKLKHTSGAFFQPPIWRSPPVHKGHQIIFIRFPQRHADRLLEADSIHSQQRMTQKQKQKSPAGKLSGGPPKTEARYIASRQTTSSNASLLLN
ncbi:hypothetical protein H0G86_007351 [Trichoderma simmonsii]|uniref:Uncharacterized protein n=1 Tax=Trichoderma simmonsii TaxID=1491479 RepID=A0A8G0PI92_9HYPO|nr:hypothetical protein H0G86_007351 [Trichoderma simmonsii]